MEIPQWFIEGTDAACLQSIISFEKGHGGMSLDRCPELIVRLDQLSPRHPNKAAGSAAPPDFQSL